MASGRACRACMRRCGIGQGGCNGLLAVGDGRLDRLEVLRSQNDAVIAWCIALLDWVAEERGVLVGEDVIHYRIHRASKVPRREYVSGKRRWRGEWLF